MEEKKDGFRDVIIADINGVVEKKSPLCSGKIKKETIRIGASMEGNTFMIEYKDAKICVRLQDMIAVMLATQKKFNDSAETK